MNVPLSTLNTVDLSVEAVRIKKSIVENSTAPVVGWIVYLMLFTFTSVDSASDWRERENAMEEELHMQPYMLMRHADMEHPDGMQ